MGSGPVSETGRYTQGTGVLRLFRQRQLNPVDVGCGSRCRPSPPWLRAGNFWSGLLFGPGGHGEGLRRSRGDAAGVEPGASPVDRTAVNVGTHDRSIRTSPAGGGVVDRPEAGAGGGAEPS